MAWRWSVADRSEITPVDNPYRHDHDPLNADFHGGMCSACEWELDDRNAWCDHLAARESALLLAVPRPFRMFVHRRAERIQRKLEAQ